MEIHLEFHVLFRVKIRRFVLYFNSPLEFHVVFLDFHVYFQVEFLANISTWLGKILRILKFKTEKRTS